MIDAQPVIDHIVPDYYWAAEDIVVLLQAWKEDRELLRDIHSLLTNKEHNGR